MYRCVEAIPRFTGSPQWPPAIRAVACSCVRALIIITSAGNVRKSSRVAYSTARSPRGSDSNDRCRSRLSRANERQHARLISRVAGRCFPGDAEDKPTSSGTTTRINIISENIYFRSHLVTKTPIYERVRAFCKRVNSRREETARIYTYYIFNLLAQQRHAIKKSH